MGDTGAVARAAKCDKSGRGDGVFLRGRLGAATWILVVAIPAAALLGAVGWLASGDASPVGGADGPARAGSGGALPVTRRGEIPLPQGTVRLQPSPRGDLLVCSLAGGAGLVVVDAGGGVRGRLPGDGYWGPASWSSDGAHLCYLTCPPGRPPEFARGRVVVYAADDGSTQSIALGCADPGPVEPVLCWVENAPPLTIVLYTEDAAYEWVPGQVGFWPAPWGWGGGQGRGSGSVAARGYHRTVHFAGEDEVVELALAPQGIRFAALCRVEGGWRLYVAGTESWEPMVLVDEGAGTAGSLTWSPEGRFLGYVASLPREGGSAARFVDLADWSLAHLAYSGAADVAWADPLGAVVLTRRGAAARAVAVTVGAPPRVTALSVHQRFPSPADPELRSFRVENGSSFTVYRNDFSIYVGYDRKVTADMACCLLSCVPGPPPDVEEIVHDKEGAICLRFTDAPAEVRQVQLRLGPIGGGDEVKLKVRRIPEPAVVIAGPPTLPYAARGGRSRLFESLPDGCDARQIGTIAGILDRPLLSPDGSFIAYNEPVQYQDDIPGYVCWVRPIRGGTPLALDEAEPVAWLSGSRLLLRNAVIVDPATGERVGALPGAPLQGGGAFSVSRSGRWVASLRAVGQDRQRVALILHDLEGWTARFAGEVGDWPTEHGGPWVVPPGWSPDERHIAISSTCLDRPRLIVVDVATTRMRTLPSGEETRGVPREAVTAETRPAKGGPPRPAVWSPDGRYLAWRAAEGWSVIAPDGGMVCRVPGLDDDQGLPMWSPEGRRLLYTAEASEGGPVVCVLAVEGRSVERIARGVAVGWTADGSRIIWATRDP